MSLKKMSSADNASFILSGSNETGRAFKIHVHNLLKRRSKAMKEEETVQPILFHGSDLIPVLVVCPSQVDL